MIFIYLLFIYFWLPWVSVAEGFFSSCGEQGLLSLRWAGFSSQRLLIAEASRRRGFSLGGVGPRCVGFGSCGSWAWGPGSVVVTGLSSFSTCGMFLDQGLNPCPLRWQVDSLALHHPGSPACKLLIPTFWWKNRGWVHYDSYFGNGTRNRNTAYIFVIVT